MPKSWVWIPAVVVALGFGLLLGRFTAPAPVGKPASADPPSTGTSKGRAVPPPLVGVAHPKRVTIPVTLSLTANIASLRSAVLYSKTAGYLEVVTVRPGDPVRAGQVVAIVDHAQLDAQVAQAEATALAAQNGILTAKVAVATAHAQLLNAIAGRQNAVAQMANAQAGVAKAAAQLKDAEATHQRMATLVKQGAAAQQTLDDMTAQVQSALATLDASAAQVNVAEAQIAQADAQIAAARQQEASAQTQVQTQRSQAASQQAALHNARLSVANATITAPFSGIVVSRSLDAGAYVTPGTSTPIVTIADLDQTDVTVNVTEVQIAAIQRGAPVSITVDAYPGRTFEGKVTRIAGGADQATRTVQVEIDIANPGHLLRPGMYATARLSVGADKDVLVVPLGALVSVGDQHFVWVVKDGKVNRHPVTIGRATGEVVEITAGLTEDDQIIARGIDLVREGQPVRPVPVGGL
ncbi:MAG TPA: efflux RND transporter periplasmic adaptor subunit [bacterium]|nr:efflux RND transporter periplasmic adaptor subunit [bacterium]